MENEAHRGAAVRFPVAGGEAILLATRTRRDARIDDAGRVSSLDDAGLHRTETEKGRRDALRERIGAFRWEGAADGLEVGFTAAGARYDPPLGGGDLSRKPDAFRGDHLAAAAADVRFGRGPLLLQAEVGRSDAGGTGGRCLLRLAGKGGRALLRFRNYSGLFHAPRSTVERRIGSEPAGETGWIAMADRRLGGARIEARYHRYASFHRTWNSAGPVYGDECSARIEAGRGAWEGRLAAGSAARSEVRGGARVRGGSASASAGGTWNGPAGRRLRLDFRWGASRTPGSEKIRTGAGLSLLLTIRRGREGRIDLSWVRLFRDERSIAFPSPALPGSLPVAWFGGGRAAGGARIAWRGRPWGRLSAAFSLGPEGASMECVFRPAGG
ncbi:MAG: hypothetical protein JW958_00010 [Candidatus Eisenbacteria bacterium]|nr:hypothetical protein [Candidatus Eisenbacteria bacterium]